MAKKQLLAFFEELHDISRTMILTREKGDWDRLEQLITLRLDLIKNHKDSNYPLPSTTDRQKIREICKSIQHSDKGILEDAKEWREQIRQFIL